MAVTYYALLTTIGAGKLANATALGTTLKITQLAVGDGGGSVPSPDASRTQLVNEVRRAPLNRLSVDPANSAQIIAEQVIPEDVGGWWIREMGLYDEAGALIAYANCAPSYKPQLAEGSGRTQTVRIVLIVSNAASVELKIDPSVVLATREYVDNSIVTALNRLDGKQSVRVASTASISLSGLQTLDGIALSAGDRVLVKNQSNAADNGIYVAATTAWRRSSDADETIEVTPSLTVAVESGATQADSIWQLVTDGVIVLGVTALTFQNITNGLARLASPAFSGNPTAPTPATSSNDNSVATTAFAGNLIHSLGLGGNSKQNGVASMNGAALGAVENYNGSESDAQANNWPVLGVAAATSVHYNVLTFGLGTRVTQIAVQVFRGGNENRTFVRTKHDSTWSVWSEQAPLSSPVLTGTPMAPTPAQFDVSARVATTESVQRALGSYSAQLNPPIPYTIQPADVGKLIVINATGNVTLPLLASVPAGSRIILRIALGSTVTVSAQGADPLVDMIGVSGPIKLTGATLAIFRPANTTWEMMEGDAALVGSSSFVRSHAGNGYQKLPGGLIIQWGSVVTNGSGVGAVTFPTAFQQSCFQVTCTPQIAGFYSLTVGSFGNASGTTGTTIFSMNSSTGAALQNITVNWMALGK